MSYGRQPFASVPFAGSSGIVLPAIDGTLAATLGDATLSAIGANPIAGTLAATLDNATLAATGANPIDGTLAATLGDATITAAGTIFATGTLAATLGDVTLAATGLVVETGRLNVTLDAVTLVSSIAGLPVPPITPRDAQLRLLNGDAFSFATPGRLTERGRPQFHAVYGDTTTMIFDWQGRLRGATISASAWEAAPPRNVPFSAYNDDDTTAVRVYDLGQSTSIALHNTVTTSDGRTLRQAVDVRT